MENKLKLLIILSAFVLIMPLISFATTVPFWGPLVPCGPGSKLPNGQAGPSQCSIGCLFTLGQNLIAFGITLATFILGPIAFVIGGFFIVTAGGSPDRLQKGKQTVTFAIIGIVIALASFVIINTFMWVIGASTLQGKVNNESFNWFDFSGTCSAPKTK